MQIKTDASAALDSSLILVSHLHVILRLQRSHRLRDSQEMMSEQSIQLRSQLSPRDGNMSTDTVGRPIVPHGLSQARKHFKYKPRFAEFSCTFAEAGR